MKIAYADPPYLGCGVKFYADHPEAAVYDTVDGHAHLVDRLCDEFPDGWAYSLTSSSLRLLLPLFPADVRIAAWVKPFHAYKKGVRPAYSWEPVIFRGGRQEGPPPAKGGTANTPKDHVVANIVLRQGFTGAKPDEFSFWLFSLLGMTRDDEFVDLFPGSGNVGRAWSKWCRATSLFDEMAMTGEPGAYTRGTDWQPAPVTPVEVEVPEAMLNIQRAATEVSPQK